MRKIASIACGTALVFLLAQTMAHAQMRDPMQPADARAAASSGAPSTRGLQGVVIAPQRKLALIDGSVVPVGGYAAKGTLVGISDVSAVLQKDGGRDVMLMHPNIDKRPAQGRTRP